MNNILESEIEAGSSKGLNNENLYSIPLEISAELGKSKMTMKEILDLKEGVVITLDKSVHDLIAISVQGKTIGYASVESVDGEYRLTVKKLIGEA